MKLFIIRYIKIIFIRLRLHKVFNPFSSVLSNIYYLSKLSEWAAQNKDVAFNDFPSKWDYEKRYPLYKKILENEGLFDRPIHYLEFGVAGGQSFKWFLKENKHEQSCFSGFDTFTGLPEDFGVYKKGMFNTQNQVPLINDTRGNFYQGLFQQTLPLFLNSFENDKKKIIMLDADLYSATLFVLTSFAPLLSKGDIIFFDEFSVPTHEYKAFHEFQQAYPHINLQLIGAANNFYFTAFKVV
jgi:O-methyltransferase